MKLISTDAQLIIDVFKNRTVKIEEHYEVFENEENELLFAIKHLNSPVDEKRGARLYYDGGEHAILIKNKEIVLICDHINPGVRDQLGRVKSVIFTELIDGLLVDEYTAEVKYMEHAQDVAAALIGCEEHW